MGLVISLVVACQNSRCVHIHRILDPIQMGFPIAEFMDGCFLPRAPWNLSMNSDVSFVFSSPFFESNTQISTWFCFQRSSFGIETPWLLRLFDFCLVLLEFCPAHFSTVLGFSSGTLWILLLVLWTRIEFWLNVQRVSLRTGSGDV